LPGKERGEERSRPYTEREPRNHLATRYRIFEEGRRKKKREIVEEGKGEGGKKERVWNIMLTRALILLYFLYGGGKGKEERKREKGKNKKTELGVPQPLGPSRANNSPALFLSTSFPLH